MMLRYDDDDDDEYSDSVIPTQQFNDYCVQNENIVDNDLVIPHESLLIVQNTQPYLNNNIKRLLKESEPNAPLYMCNICDEIFTTTSNLEIHTKEVHTNIIENVDDNAHVSSNMTVSCDHCNLEFPNPQLLIAHLYDVVGTKQRNRNPLCKNKTVQQQNITRVLNSNISTTYVYRCTVCSYYFKNIKILARHMNEKHKIKNLASQKKILYDPKCKFCPSKFSKIARYNAHIFTVHRNILCSKSLKKSIKPKSAFNHDKKVEKDVFLKTNSLNSINEEDPPAVNDTKKNHQAYILKSVLFKCTICDILFLNFQNAKDHVSHMDILINWKCTICKHTFMKNDEKDHMLQHTVTNDFTIYDISDSPPLFLYNCSKCNAHFDENIYFQHFPGCKADYFMISECESCNIWLDVNLIGSHNCLYQAGSSKSTGYIIVKTDLIKKDTLNQDLGNINKDLTVKRNVLRTGNVSSDMSTKTNKSFKVYYCKNCKCFVNYYCIIKHKTANCKDSGDPIVCISCGLVYPKKSNSYHARLHKKNLNLTLQNFEFYDLDSKQLINPPFPEFPQCGACEIFFARQIDKAQHCCGAQDYTICLTCNLNFSELGYRIHMFYHNLTSSHKYCNEESPFKRTKCDYKIYQCKKCQICITCEESSHKHVCSSRILKSKCSICGLYWHKRDLKNHNALHISDSNFIIDNITLIDINSTNTINTDSILAASTCNKVIENLETTVTSPKEVELQQKTNSDQGKVVTRKLYRCSCGLHFLNRNSILVHQNTTCRLKKNARQQKCSKCGLSFDTITFFKHLVKHHSGIEETTKFHIINISKKTR